MTLNTPREMLNRTLSTSRKTTPASTLPDGHLLNLPNEVLLQIAGDLQRTVKEHNPHRDLISLALTCKRFPPISQESLYTAPILDSAKVSSFLTSLFRYPDIRIKVHSLTIESKKIRGQKAITPSRIRGLKPDLLHHCISQIRTLPMDSDTKEDWITYFNTGTFDPTGLLLGLTLTMLPKLTALYLGSTVFQYLPLLRSVTVLIKGTSDPWDSMPNMDDVLQILGSQLTTLELLNDTLLEPWWRMKITGFSTHLPKLTTLAVPVQLLPTA
ncbi:F-box domain containing protein [Pyrenophora tritici-repentis]|uniref:F-box domain containing protein n=1 Tax=Pyrenophora tritici-repentis TaxID=45151 RepID=A0A922T2Z6_9PLEO|nr:F-box domain containing protein [Pyrenophora tritici-repentis]